MDEQGTATRLGLNPRAALFVLLVFSLSRLLVFGAMATSSLVLPRSQVAGWDLDNPILRPLFRWDTGWYLSIATRGYSYDGNPEKQQNVVFFPLYPLTCRLCHAITGVSVPLCGVVLSNGALLGALATLYVLVTREVGAASARLTLVLLSFFPGSLFFSTMYTESFYLLFSAQAFLAFNRERFILCGGWVGLASATRLPGILLLAPLFARAPSPLKDRQMFGRVVLAALLGVCGLAGFMTYQLIAFGDPFVYIRDEQAWGKFSAHLFGRVRTSIPAAFDAGFTLAFGALTYVVFRTLPRGYGIYTVLSIMVPLAGGQTRGMTRYLAVLFPGFIALAVMGQERRWIPWFAIPAFAFGLGYLCVRFAQWYFAS